MTKRKSYNGQLSHELYYSRIRSFGCSISYHIFVIILTPEYLVNSPIISTSWIVLTKFLLISYVYNGRPTMNEACVKLQASFVYQSEVTMVRSVTWNMIQNPSMNLHAAGYASMVVWMIGQFSVV